MAREQGTSATRGSGLEPGTLRRGGLAALLLACVVAGIAWFAFDRRQDSPIEAYLRQGPAAGAAALQADLLAASPPGTPPAPAVQRLEGLGFACIRLEEAWRCTRAEPGEGRRIRRAEAVIALDREVTRSVAVRFAEEAR
ncbi:hypothetical protein [Roseicella aquatilis]|uniref:Uncharacterized protein n=1 Tax=Roseicella aquatilis TaxID=2527868 RepID=A0A4R4D8A7_9PROT|nr:hypothetical protein [Roseicella aquatilis]TCZ56308.1 hypothetical protein EXY23_20215 [Roseicella aquatilis]